MLISGALALMLADRIPWKFVYTRPGILLFDGHDESRCCAELLESVAPPRSLKEAVFNPLIEYFKRKGSAGKILLFHSALQAGRFSLPPPWHSVLSESGIYKNTDRRDCKNLRLRCNHLGLLAGGILGLQSGNEASHFWGSVCCRPSPSWIVFWLTSGRISRRSRSSLRSITLQAAWAPRRFLPTWPA